MVWITLLMSDSFARVGQLAGVVVGFILGQVEIRLLERRPKWGKLDQGDVVGRGGSSDGGRVHSGHDHGAVGSALDESSAPCEGLGQVGVLHGPDPERNAWEYFLA